MTDTRFTNVLQRNIPAAGRFPWIENPGAVRAAFADFARRIVAEG